MTVGTNLYVEPSDHGGILEGHDWCQHSNTHPVTSLTFLSDLSPNTFCILSQSKSCLTGEKKMCSLKYPFDFLHAGLKLKKKIINLVTIHKMKPTGFTFFFSSKLLDENSWSVGDHWTNNQCRVMRCQRLFRVI